MATYYVGPGGNDGNGGTSWAQRKLTLTGAEDIPVAANDTVYVGPGVYREQLTCDVSGSSGQPITYIGDVTGENTDGIGGIVRVTGSDDDQTETRSYAIYGSGRTYRVFRGFSFDVTSSSLVFVSSTANGWIVEDCHFSDQDTSNSGLDIETTTGDVFLVRRCIFTTIAAYSISLSGDAVSSSCIIENCLFYASGNSGVSIYATGSEGTLIRNCSFISTSYGVQTAFLVSPIYVYNCIFKNCYFALYSSGSGQITEDYNSIDGSNLNERTSVSTGSNSNTYPMLVESPLLFSGTRFPWGGFALSEWSQIKAIAGTNEASDDLYGVTRPSTSSKKSWGALQYRQVEREASTTRGASRASIKIADAGSFLTYVAVVNSEITIGVYIYREHDYSGTAPQMVIHEPGQSDRTTAATGGNEGWEQLSDTFTPQAESDYVVVEVRSNNTATSGNFAIYVDDFSVTQ